MNIADIEVASLIPHAGEIVLLDRLETFTEDSINAHTVVRDDGLFNNTPHQVPSFIAIEYMAQAIAAWAGYRGKSLGQPVKIGLLLGTRDFKASVDYMPVGAKVQVRIQRIMEMANGMAVFDGWVTGDGIEISGRLSVLSVASLESLDSSLI